MTYYDAFTYPDASHEPYGTADTVARALGSVVIEFEMLDEQIRAAISFLLRRDENIGRIVTAELSFKNKVNLLAALFRQQKANSPDIDRLDELGARFFEIEQQRNRVVHSKWKGQLFGNSMTIQKYTARHRQGLRRQEESLTPGQVEAIALHCGYLAFCLDELMFAEFGEAYGMP